MLNKLIMTGRLVADPEMKTFGDAAVCKFRIACDRDYTKKGEEKKADFISVEAWRGTAEFIGKWFTKGRTITLVGRVQENKWKDRDGNPRTEHIMVAENAYFGDSAKKDDENGGNGSYPHGFTPDFGDDGGLPDGFTPDFSDNGGWPQ